jgi:hypothetical protein
MACSLTLKTAKENKIMKKEFKDLTTSLDILNTVHGGISEPYVSMQENEGGREIHVKVPGINKETMQAEIINNNQLSVYYLIPVVSSGVLMHLPKVIFNEVVPNSIDVLNIKASWHESDFIVKLPFNKLPNGNHRKIQIDND